jgi:hypothetical protein
MEFIWQWRYALQSGYRELVLGHRSEEYSGGKEWLVHLLCAKGRLLASRERLLGLKGSLEGLLMGKLGRIPLDGDLSQDLEAGARWRAKAAQLSRAGADAGAVVEFQLEMVKAASWGAYGSLEEKEKVLEYLRERPAGME